MKHGMLLTEVGQERISNCGRNYNLAHVQHPECDSLPLEHLYKSCKEIVTVIESTLQMFSW